MIEAARAERERVRDDRRQQREAAWNREAEAERQRAAAVAEEKQRAAIEAEQRRAVEAAAAAAAAAAATAAEAERVRIADAALVAQKQRQHQMAREFVEFTGCTEESLVERFLTAFDFNLEVRVDFFQNVFFSFFLWLIFFCRHGKNNIVSF